MAEPRVFTVPEPGPEVLHVRDKDGRIWSRTPESGWFCQADAGHAVAAGYEGISWFDTGAMPIGPAHYFPLTDVTDQMEPRIPPYPTPEAYEAACRALGTLREKFRALAALARSDGMDTTATNVQRVLEGKYDPGRGSHACGRVSEMPSSRPVARGLRSPIQA